MSATICAAWRLTSNGPPFWNEPSGPFAQTRPDGRLMLADTDDRGCPVVLYAVCRSDEHAPDHTGEERSFEK